MLTYRLSVKSISIVVTLDSGFVTIRGDRIVSRCLMFIAHSQHAHYFRVSALVS